MTQGFEGLFEIVKAIALVYGAFAAISMTKHGAKNIDKAGVMMKKIATAMLLMIGVMKLVGTLSSEEIFNGVVFATAFTAFVAVLGVIGNGFGEGVAKLGKGIKSIIVAMGLMVGVTKLIGLLSLSDIAKGILFATSFAVFVGILSALTKTENGHVVAGLTALLLSVSVSMTLMAGVVKIVSGLSIGEMVKAAGFAAAFLVFVETLVKVTTIAGDQQTAKIAGSILAISVAVGILAGVAVLLGMVDVKNLLKGEIAVAALCAMMAVAVRQLRGANDVGKSLTGMAVSIGVMAASVVALSLIKPEKLTAATLALSTLMGMFAIVEKASSVATTSIKNIIVMTAVVAALAGLLVLMSKYNFNASASNAAALSTVMLGLAAATVLLGKVEEIPNSAIVAMAALAVIMASIGVVLGLMNKYNLTTNIATVVSLAVVMNALAAACLIVSKIPPLPVSAIGKISLLMVAVVAISSLFVALAGAVDLIPGAEAFLDGGIRVLEKIGTGIGTFIGSILGGITVGMTKDLPEVGHNIVTFINEFSNISDSSTKGLDTFVSFATAILALSVSNIIDHIAKALGFGTGLDNFGEEAKKFGEAMSAMSDALTENPIDSEAIEGAVNAGKLLAELKQSIPPDPGDILKKFVFSRDLGNFGEQAKQFGEALGEMSTALQENPVDTKAIKNAVNAGKMLSGLKENLPPDPGDILSLFVTNKNLGNFGEQAKQFGEALSAMSKAVSGENAIDVDAIDNAKRAGELLSALKSSLEGDPGAVISLFTTNKNLGKFGEQAQVFGEAIGTMSKAISGKNAIDMDAVKNAKNVGTMLTELQKALPKDEWFDGVMQIDDFGGQIQSLGYSIQSFGECIAVIDITDVNSAVTQAKRMVALANSIADKSDDIESGVSAFGGITGIGASIEEYGESVLDLDMNKLSDSIRIGYRLKSFISSLKDIDTTGIGNFKEAVSRLSKVELGGIQNTLNDSTKSFATTGKSLVEALNSGVSSQQTKSSSTMMALIGAVQKTITDKNESFKQNGIALMTMFAVGMQAQREHISNIASQIGVAAANGSLNPAYSYMNNNGRNLGLGLVYGINSMQQSAYNAGYALGQAAVRGERAGQQSHSPSKATYQSGIWLGEGMINACHDIATKVFKAGRMLGEGTVDAVSTAMQSAEDIFDATADAAPVISPVVDLTDIRSGAAQITSMFNNPSLAPMTNIRAISGMMNERQNGNSDVVSAINGLKKSLGNTGNTYNNISGITYDSGTAVSDAIETLVRAAKIERRR